MGRPHRRQGGSGPPGPDSADVTSVTVRLASAVSASTVPGPGRTRGPGPRPRLDSVRGPSAGRPLWSPGHRSGDIDDRGFMTRDSTRTVTSDVVPGHSGLGLDRPGGRPAGHSPGSRAPPGPVARVLVGGPRRPRPGAPGPAAARVSLPGGSSCQSRCRSPACHWHGPVTEAARRGHRDGRGRQGQGCPGRPPHWHSHRGCPSGTEPGS